MKTKESKTQTEVWEWKEKAYELMKDLSTEEQIQFIKAQTRATIAEIKLRKAQYLKEA